LGTKYIASGTIKVKSPLVWFACFTDTAKAGIAKANEVTMIATVVINAVNRLPFI
jgi:hypothetical protein